MIEQKSLNCELKSHHYLVFCGGNKLWLLPMWSGCMKSYFYHKSHDQKEKENSYIKYRLTYNEDKHSVLRNALLAARIIFTLIVSLLSFIYILCVRQF